MLLSLYYMHSRNCYHYAHSYHFRSWLSFDNATTLDSDYCILLRHATRDKTNVYLGALYAL